MRKMTCRQLGGACDLEFAANTFEEIAALSQQHGKEMFEKMDAAHLEAMSEMRELMSQPDAMQKWFEERKLEFQNLSEE